ncbi:MAG: tetratricopeptide repeat-containing sensor histidine kinase [Chitinophagales bacterium]|nr:tetratricopeptide repeat-containing sensor histidine kinase [Chitinophagales bacterium]
MEYLKPLLKRKALLLFICFQFSHFGIYDHLTAQVSNPPTVELSANQQDEFNDLNQQLSDAPKIEDQAKALANLVAFFSKFDVESMNFYIVEIDQLVTRTDNETARAFYSFAKAFDYAQQNDFEKALKSAQLHLSQIKQLRLDSISMLKGFYQVAYFFDDLGRRDSMLHYLEMAEKLVPKNGQKYLGQIYSLYGRAYLLLSEPEKSVQYKRKAIAIKKEVNDPSIAIDQANLGTYYFGQNQHEKAFEVWSEALNYFEKEANFKAAFTLSCNISVLLLELENTEGSREYSERAVSLAKKDNNTIGLAEANLMLSNVENALFNYKASIDFSLKALRFAELSQNQYTIGYCHYVVGTGYYNLNQLDSAQYHLNQCISLYEEHAVSSLAVFSYASHSALGEINKTKGAYKKAIKNFHKYIDWLEQNGRYQRAEYDRYESLGETYEAIGDYKNALTFFKKGQILKDSLLNAENIQEVTELKKEADFKIEKEKTQLQHQAELERETLIQKGLLIGLGMLMLLLFFIYQNFRNTKKKNKIIQNQKAELERLNQTKDHLFSIIGHDLRKPTISFRGITEKLRYLIDAQDFKMLIKFGQVIEENAFALTKLTDNLLNWALTQKQAISYRPTTFSVAAVTEDIFDLFQTIASYKGVELKTDIPEDLEIHTDLNSFDLIFRNLIDNALKYTPKGGIVEVSAKSENYSVEMLVKDSGIGIPSEKLEGLFALKENKSEPGTAGEKGTGLGLHLVNELVKLNKGKIGVESQLGKGSAFNIIFPVQTS